MKPKRCSISWCWYQTLLAILGGVTASQPSENSKINKIKLAPLYHSYITKDKVRTFEASEALDALRASFLDAPGSNIHIIIT